jgi:hypothetical protein
MAKKVADDINDWMYSIGGLCAGAKTRGAIVQLRTSCRSWASSGNKPTDLYVWRNSAMLLLRAEIGVKGLEAYGVNDPPSILNYVRELVETQETANQRKGGRKSVISTGVGDR